VVSVIPGADARNGTRSYAFTLTATMVVFAGDAPTASAGATAIVSPAPPPPAPDNTARNVGIVLAIALAFALALLWYEYNPRVAIAAPEPWKPLDEKRVALIPVTLKNHGRSDDVALLSVEGVPEKWKATLGLAEVPLKAREKRGLWLSLRAPKGDEGGAPRVRVVAASKKHPGRRSTVEVGVAR
ncbi:MAG: hypothetical protein ACT4PT_11455, partial [Methanobacteriota archaeon]